MEVFFADDSQQSARREGIGKLVAFGGIFLDESTLRPLHASIDEIAASYGIPKGEELKWSPKNNSWIYKNLIGEARKSCYSQVLQKARDLKARAMVVVWDTGRTGHKPEDALEKCMHYAFERIEMHLDDRKSAGIIVADKPGGGKDQEEDLLSEFLERVQSGTEYVVPKNVSLNVLTSPSHLVRQLQLADLVVGITTAMVEGQYDYAQPLFEIIRPMFIQNYYGFSGGAGLKLCPDDLINIYHWVLKEDVYCKVAKSSGISLPKSGAAYETNEFKIKNG